MLGKQRWPRSLVAPVYIYGHGLLPPAGANARPWLVGRPLGSVCSEAGGAKKLVPLSHCIHWGTVQFYLQDTGVLAMKSPRHENRDLAAESSFANFVWAL